MSQHQPYEGIFNTANWLYDLHVISDGYAVIHIPLLYLTKLRIQHELYATSLIDFSELCNLRDILQAEVIDDGVVRFPAENLSNFRNQLFQMLTGNIEVQRLLIKNLLNANHWLPVSCLRAEKEYLDNGKISSVILKRLLDTLIRLIAINYANPFCEIAFIRAKREHQDEQAFMQQVENTLWKPVFSNMTYYSQQLEELRQKAKSGDISVYDVAEFTWNCGFLENATGDGSTMESVEHVYEVLNINKPDKAVIDMAKLITDLNIPDINYDPSGITNAMPGTDDLSVHTLLLMRFLQVNEEFRHYWGLRVIRLCRLLAPDQEARENWGIEDYEKHLTKQ